jgi:hypothetical protein
MMQVNLSDQELFDIIMALYAFEKTSAVPPIDASEVLKFQEVARQRQGLLDKLHDVFDQNTMLPYWEVMDALQGANVEFGGQG